MRYYIERFIITIVYGIGLGILYVLNLFKKISPKYMGSKDRMGIP